MSARKRLTPLGTRPPPVARGCSKRLLARTYATSGTIETPVVDPALAAHKQALEEQRDSVIVQIEDDWLARLDLPID